MAYLGDTTFPLIVRGASKYNQIIKGSIQDTHTSISGALHSIHSLYLISQQCWDMGYSRKVEVLFLLSGSKSVLVGSIATLAVTCPPQQLWGRGGGS